MNPGHQILQRESSQLLVKMLNADKGGDGEDRGDDDNYGREDAEKFHERARGLREAGIRTYLNGRNNRARETRSGWDRFIRPLKRRGRRGQRRGSDTPDGVETLLLECKTPVRKYRFSTAGTGKTGRKPRRKLTVNKYMYFL
jgi:hypothetical protein